MNESDWIRRGFRRYSRQHGRTAYTRSAGVFVDLPAELEPGLRIQVTGEAGFNFPGPDGDCYVYVGRPGPDEGIVDPDAPFVCLYFDNPGVACYALTLWLNAHTETRKQ